MQGQRQARLSDKNTTTRPNRSSRLWNIGGAAGPGLRWMRKQNAIAGSSFFWAAFRAAPGFASLPYPCEAQGYQALRIPAAEGPTNAERVTRATVCSSLENLFFLSKRPSHQHQRHMCTPGRRNCQHKRLTASINTLHLLFTSFASQ